MPRRHLASHRHQWKKRSRIHAERDYHSVVLSRICTVLLHILIASSTFFSATAFISGDPRGEQSFGIWIGWGIAAVAVLIAAVALAFHLLDNAKETAGLIVMAFAWPLLALAGARMSGGRFPDASGRVLSLVAVIVQATIVVSHIRRSPARRRDAWRPD
jgi:hypothetical protein